MSILINEPFNRILFVKIQETGVYPGRLAYSRQEFLYNVMYVCYGTREFTLRDITHTGHQPAIKSAALLIGEFQSSWQSPTVSTNRNKENTGFNKDLPNAAGV